MGRACNWEALTDGILWYFCKMCSSRKYPYSPHRRDWNFLGDGGFWKIKKYKEMYEASLEFPEGWGGVRKKSLLWGRYRYFLELHNEKAMTTTATSVEPYLTRQKYSEYS